MEVEMAFADLRRRQGDMRRPVDIDVLRSAWSQRGNCDRAHLQPARGITHANARRIRHQEAYVGVDGSSISTVAHVRVDPVFVVSARIIAVTDDRAVGTAAVTKSGGAYVGFIAVAGTVDTDVHGLVSIHRRGQPRINENIRMSRRDSPGHGNAEAIANA